MMIKINSQILLQPFKQIYAGAVINKKVVAVALAVIASIGIAAIAIGAAAVAPFAVTLPVGGVMMAGISLALIAYLWKQGRHAG
jgi:hypothetical protein